MKKILITLVIFLSCTSVCSAQALGRHTYFHVGMANSLNIATAGMSVLTAGCLNYLTHTNIFEGSIGETSRSGKTNGEKMGFKRDKYFSFKARDMFALVEPSIKLGYITSYEGNFNWGLYGEALYRFEQFRVSPVKADKNYSRQRMERALFGGSGFVVIGGATKDLHVMLEAGLRYNTGLSAKGVLGGKDDFRDGLTSHYGVKLTGQRGEYDFGIYLDINHFDYLKSSTQKFRNISYGITYNYTFGQIKKMLDE